MSDAPRMQLNIQWRNTMKTRRRAATAPGILVLLLLAGCADGGDPVDPSATTPTGRAAGTPATAPALPPARPTMGTLTTTLGGESMEWQILAGVPGDELRRPSGSVAAQGPMLLLSLQGTAAEDRSRQASLSASLMQQGGGYVPTGHEMSLHPEGLRGPHLEARELEVEWDRMELSAEGGHVSGRFRGLACQVAGVSGEAGDCRPLEGSFDSEVRNDAVVQDILDTTAAVRP